MIYAVLTKSHSLPHTLGPSSSPQWKERKGKRCQHTFGQDLGDNIFFFKKANQIKNVTLWWLEEENGE